MDNSVDMGSNTHGFNMATDPRVASLKSPEKSNRKTWSAPNEGIGLQMGLSRTQRGPGPGEGPNYGGAKLTNRIEKQQQNSFADPLQHLHRGHSNGHYQNDTTNYSPSVYDVNGARVNPGRKIGDLQYQDSYG